MNKLDQLVHDWGWWNRAYTRLLIRARGYRLESMPRVLPHVSSLAELVSAKRDGWLPLKSQREFQNLTPPAIALGDEADEVVDYYRREFPPTEYHPGVAYFHQPVLYGRQFSILSHRRAFEECFVRDRRWRKGVPKKPPVPKKISGTYLLAGGEFHNHFAHLFCDVLPRLSLFEEGGLLDRMPVLLPPAGPSFAEEAWTTLDLTGGDSQRWDDGCWQVDGLYFAAPFKKFCSWTPESAAWMRRKFSPGLEERPAGKRFFYISRRGAPRSMENEEAILAALKPFGVEVVQPEKLSLRRQIELFAEAAAIVGPQGAGIQNALWAPRGCAMLELVNTRFFSGVYWTLAESLGHRYGLVAGKSAPGEDPVHANYSCDEKLVVRALDVLLHRS